MSSQPPGQSSDPDSLPIQSRAAYMYGYDSGGDPILIDVPDSLPGGDLESPDSDVYRDGAAPE